MTKKHVLEVLAKEVNDRIQSEVQGVTLFFYDLVRALARDGVGIADLPDGSTSLIIVDSRGVHSFDKDSNCNSYNSLTDLILAESSHWLKVW